MSEKRLAFSLIALALGSILLVGHLNARDLKACVDGGRSTETCMATFNP